MNIERDLLTVNPFSRPGKNLSAVKALVIHWVANAGSTARQNRNYFENLKNQAYTPDARYASAHFIVGLKGEVIQCIPSAEMAYHVGAKNYTPFALGCLGSYPNDCTIGIELCHPKNDGSFLPETTDAARELCALLCVQLNLDPIADIIMHYDVTGKICPKWYVEHPQAFEDFKQSVAEKIQTLRSK